MSEPVAGAGADGRDAAEAVATLCAIGPAEDRHFARHGSYATASAEPNGSDHGSSRPVTSGWVELGLPLSAQPRCAYEVWAVAADQAAGPLRGVAGATGRAAPAGPSWYAQATCRDRPHLLVLFVQHGADRIEDLSPPRQPGHPSPPAAGHAARCPPPTSAAASAP